jgi:hypothetical protein
MQFFSALQYTSDAIVVPYCMKLHHQHSFLVPENSHHQLSGRRLFKLFALFGECLCIYCLDRTLVSTFKNETQASSPFIHTM